MSDNKCRAKDPNTCPYHGAKLRFGSALAALATNPSDPDLIKQVEKARHELDEVLKKNNGIWKELQDVYNPETGLTEQVTILTEVKEYSKPFIPNQNPVRYGNGGLGVTSNWNGDYKNVHTIDGIYTNLHPNANAVTNVAVHVIHPTHTDKKPELFTCSDEYDFDKTAPFTKVRVSFRWSKLNDDEEKAFLRAFNYVWAEKFGGENIEVDFRDTDKSLIIEADSTKTKNFDIDKFEETLAILIEDGTEPDPATGEKAINPFPHYLEYALYYNSEPGDGDS